MLENFCVFLKKKNEKSIVNLVHKNSVFLLYGPQLLTRSSSFQVPIHRKLVVNVGHRGFVRFLIICQNVVF